MNTRHYLTHCIFIFLLEISFSQDAHSYGKNCVSPSGPITYSDGIVIGIHSHPKNKELCIHNFNPKQDCTDCKSGFIHICAERGWTPLGKECSKKNAFKPDDNPKNSTSDPNSFQDEQQSDRSREIQYQQEKMKMRHQEDNKNDSDYTHRENDRLCKILTTC